VSWGGREGEGEVAQQGGLLGGGGREQGARGAWSLRTCQVVHDLHLAPHILPVLWGGHLALGDGLDGHLRPGGQQQRAAARAPGPGEAVAAGLRAAARRRCEPALRLPLPQGAQEAWRTSWPVFLSVARKVTPNWPRPSSLPIL
jgi:hypothetical protein